MKQKIVLGLFTSLVFILICAYSSGYGASTGGGNLTGATGNSGCSCHNSTSSIGTTVQLDSAGVLVTSYRPGVSYTVKISAANNTTHTTLSHFGFQLSTVKLTGAGTGSAVQAGTWGTSLPANVQNTTSGTIPVIEQSSAITATTGTGAAGGATTYVESIPWTAPAAGTGTIKIYGIINAVNYNGSSSGDYYQAATAVNISEIAPTVTASVQISETSGSNPTCASSSVTFTATPTNGGTAPTYQWQVNGTNVATGASYTTSSLTTGAVVKCIMTSNLSGVTGSPATSNTITMTVNPTVTPSVSIATNNTTVCAGSSVTFNATPTNGGTPSYQWQVNGVNAGTNSSSFTTTTLANNASVTCIMTSTATCASPTTATSSPIVMTVNPSVTPSVVISTADSVICSGTSASFTATPTNGGTPSYQWKVNGVNAGTNSATFSSSSLTTGALVTCVMTSTASCAVPSTATSNTVHMTVNPTVTPSLIISTPSTSVCPGSSVTFTTLPTNGGNAPTYQWKVNGTNVATGSSYTTTTLANNDVVTCVITSNATCASTTTATSNSLTMSVATQTPSITITALHSSICSGGADTFAAVAVNGGLSPAFQWKVNNVNAGTNSSTFISSSLTTGASVTCVLTSSLSCASPANATSNTETITVNPTVTPTVNIAATHDTICPGSAVTFTASGTNLGTTPIYQWVVNSTNSGTDSIGFTTTALANNNTVHVVVTSDATCASPVQATSSNITMDVLAAPPVTITPSGALTLCAGDSLLLTASGGSPYHWTNTDTTTTIWVKQAGTYDVRGTNGTCSANAAPAIVTVNTPSVPTVSKTGNVITSTPSDKYQWILNGTNLQGDTTQSYTIIQSGNYSVITTDSAGCPATSINYLFTYVNGINSIGEDLGVKLYPVPNQGSFIVEGANLSNANMEIYNIYGQKVYEQGLISGRTQISNMDLVPAIYFVTISSGGKSETIKMEIVKE